VTVGRFRAFLAAYPTWKPTAGAGVNPAIPGSGWSSAWDTELADQVTLITNLSCDGRYATWTNAPAASEDKPINCVDWFEAFAFCIWDGGRLPTEAEWEYVASGGEDRVTPWEVPTDESAPDKSRACFGKAPTLPAVGSTPLGGARWGQQDLAGSLWEWTADWYGVYPKSATVNYGGAASGTELARIEVERPAAHHALRAAARGHYDPRGRYSPMGVRCARGVP
jgi:sulfatase modifying factor 1